MKALITNCTRNSGLAAMRALAVAGWSALGADDRVLPLGLRSRHAAAPYECLPAARDPQYAEALLTLLDRLRPDVLIPTRGMEAACRIREEVGKKTRSLLPSPEAFEVLNDKARLLERSSALGIPAPRAFELDAAVRFLKEGRGASVVVRPRRDVGGGEGVRFVADAGALAGIHETVAAEHGGAVITEYVPGRTDSLRAVHLLFDASSRLIAFFVLRKLRIHPPGVGVTVAAVSTHEIGLVERLLPLFRQIGWQGPADAELKIDERDGEAKVIEINPRFSGAIHFPIGCGVNFPLLYCRAAAGERLEEASRPAYRDGMRYVDFGRWLAGVAAELWDGQGGRTAILRRARDELRGPRVRSVHQLTDLAPLLGKLLWMLPGRGQPAAAPDRLTPGPGGA